MGEGDHLAHLIQSQRAYYDLRAPDHGNDAMPDRKVSGLMARDLSRDLIDEFAPTGEVLELACGNGAFTRDLIRHARSLTAVDASPRMLALNLSAVADSRVNYVEADIFEWRPDRQYDAVFFGFWLSHVPPVRFESFWTLVRSAVRPGGRVAFVDEDDRGKTNDDIHVVEDVPVAPRTLRDGRQFEIVKVYWDPTELEDRLRALDWNVAVRRVGDTFLHGSGLWGSGS